MAIPDISNTYYTSPAYQQASKPSSSLDKDGFLKMLTEQIKNQDPSSNQDPTQYFNTISQMTLVEQLTNLAQASGITDAQQMIGRTVTYDRKDGTSASGIVSSVQIDGGKPTLTIGSDVGVEPSTVSQIK